MRVLGPARAERAGAGVVAAVEAKGWEGGTEGTAAEVAQAVGAMLRPPRITTNVGWTGEGEAMQAEDGAEEVEAAEAAAAKTSERLGTFRVAKAVEGARLSPEW